MTGMRQSSRLSGRAVALAVPLVNEVAALARSLVLARMLGPDELGRAMLLALTLRLVEMASDIGIERLLSQAPDGEDPRFQANLQGAVLLRGLAMAGVLLALAWPMTWGFEGGPSASSFALLALVPMMRAFVHLDHRRFERNFDYRGLAVVDGLSAVLMLLSAPAITWAVGDHTAILWICAVQAGSAVVLSHIVSRRRYALRFERAEMIRMWAFGAPLILNALLMFVTLQADRLIVAGWFTWAEVGIYGVALQLALLPALILGRAATSLLAPKFRLALAAGRLADEALPVLRIYLGLGALFTLAYGLAAGPVITAIYGPAFVTPPLQLWAFGLAAGLRILRTPLTQLSVTMGRTGDPARANLLRALFVLPAVGVAVLGLPLAGLALAAAAGEAAAALRGWHLVRRSIRRTAPSTDTLAQPV
jgi:O-antigen/teichoic acid export membrane protein